MQDLRQLISFRSSVKLYKRNQVFFSGKNIERLIDTEKQQNENIRTFIELFLHLHMCMSNQNA